MRNTSTDGSKIWNWLVIHDSGRGGIFVCHLTRRAKISKKFNDDGLLARVRVPRQHGLGFHALGVPKLDVSPHGGGKRRGKDDCMGSMSEPAPQLTPPRGEKTL